MLSGNFVSAAWLDVFSFSFEPFSLFWLSRYSSSSGRRFGYSSLSLLISASVLSASVSSSVFELSLSEVDDFKLNQLEKYYEMLIKYNEVMNLTAITKKEDVYLKHFYDSLLIIKAVDLNNIESLLDIGCGAGFPGLVIKIFYPHIKLTY